MKADQKVEAPRGGGSKKLIIIILALVLVLGAAAAVRPGSSARQGRCRRT
jgi:flagellar basal body-associated protein FliL